MQNQIQSTTGPTPSDCQLSLAPDPQPWDQPVDGQLLLDELADLTRRFLVLPQCAPEALALWILHTYAWELRDVSTYLGIESPEKRCGKTTLLTLLSELVNRPVVAANISSPAFFRVIEELRPTLLIDEADTVLRSNEELRGILNSGYGRKTAFVVRVAADTSPSRFKLPTPETDPNRAETAEPETSRLARFSSWCPKAIAAIGRLPDTLADRCIIIRMHRKARTESCQRLRNLDTTSLRRRCARFVADAALTLPAAQPDLPDDLHDRAADIWEPLLALADLAGGQWPSLARQASVHLTLTAQDNNPIGSLLFDIFLLFVTQKKDRFFSRDLVQALNTFHERPWMDLRHGQAITELWLAQRLRPYGLHPRTIRVGPDTAKGYFEADFMDIFRRYIPRAEVEAFRQETRELQSTPQPTNP